MNYCAANLSVCVCVCVFEWLWTPTHGFHVLQLSYVCNVVVFFPFSLHPSSSLVRILWLAVLAGASESWTLPPSVSTTHSVLVCVCTHSSGHSVIQAFARICRQQCNTDCYLLWSSALLAMGQREVIHWWCPGLDH